MVRATVLNETTSGKHKAKLMGVIVAETSGDLWGGDWYRNNVGFGLDHSAGPGS